MKSIIETKRCILREFTINDASNLLELNSDENVLKHTGDKPFQNLENAESFVINYHQYAKYGMGRWTCILKEDHSFLGWCGLKYRPKTDEVNLGFRFLKKYWNCGFATECGRASLEYGFKNLQLKRIVARVRKENHASQRVIKKLGMQFEKEILMEGHAALQYELKYQLPKLAGHNSTE